MGVIGLFLRMVISAPTSMRSAAAVLELFGPYLPGVSRTPCANSGRFWLLRVGLHELLCEKEKADDWVWMMDHTIQLGPWKCLIVVGIRLSRWLSDRRPLRHEDMTLLNLTPMKQSTGEKVHEQLKATMEKVGRPRAVVSDGGTDLKRSMEFLHEDHPQVHHILDMKHKNATLLKRELTSDDRWASFVTQTNKTKLGVTQTSLAFLNPPSLKTKARYMNLDTLVCWGLEALAYLDRPGDVLGQPVDRHKLREKLGWLRQYRRALEDWSELLAIARAAEDYVHSEGVHPLISDELQKLLEPLATRAGGRRLKTALLRFVAEQSASLPEGERLIGSTEVLESIIGKYKRLQSSHSKGGMTAMLLSIGAIVGHKATAAIKTALQSVTTDDVSSWCRKHLGVTLQAQRKLALGATKTG
ncbi:hypothetical protein ACFLR1_04835 [Bacteroidota bacterium]